MIYMKALGESLCVNMYSGELLLDSRSYDIWEILETGALKSIYDDKCLGKSISDVTRVEAVDCESQHVINWSLETSNTNNMLFNMLFNIHFKTYSGGGWTGTDSSGSFEIDGYGDIPKECHNTTDAECDIELYGMDTFTIRADTTDGWAFFITGDIGDLIEYKTVKNGTHYRPFPTFMDSDQFDFEQTYAVQIYDSNECFKIHFKTTMWEHAASIEINGFHIDGYGNLPHSCHSNLGSECDIQICGRRTLVIRAYTTDEWQFEVSGDIGDLRQYKTAPTGTHKVIATMSNDKYDYLQAYELKPFSSCKHRAIEGGECDSNKEYMLQNCTMICNLLPLVCTFRLYHSMLFITTIGSVLFWHHTTYIIKLF